MNDTDHVDILIKLLFEILLSSINPIDVNCNGKNGKFNPENTITGCSCRDEFEKPTKYHGWHCEISNFDLCDPSSSDRNIHS